MTMYQLKSSDINYYKVITAQLVQITELLFAPDPHLSELSHCSLKDKFPFFDASIHYSRSDSIDSIDKLFPQEDPEIFQILIQIYISLCLMPALN